MLLNPESKRALLEQALKCKSSNGYSSTVFAKVLFSSKSCVKWAREKNVYRFGVNLGWSSHVHVFFEDHTGNRTKEARCRSFDVVRLLFSMLNPSFFQGDVHRPNKLVSAVELLKDSTCKISLRCDFRLVPEMIVPVWTRVVEVNIPGYIFLSGPPPTTHPLDKLTVRHIQSADQFASWLRQNTKEFRFELGYFDFGGELEQIGIEANESVKSCKVSVTSAASKDCLSIGRKLITTLPNLKNLEIRSSYVCDWDSPIVGHLGEIADAFGSIKGLADIVDKAQISSRICFHLNVHAPEEEGELDWFEGLKEMKPEFNDARVCNCFDGSCVYLEQKTKHVAWKFNIARYLPGLDDAGNTVD